MCCAPRPARWKLSRLTTAHRRYRLTSGISRPLPLSAPPSRRRRRRARSFRRRRRSPARPRCSCPNPDTCRQYPRWRQCQRQPSPHRRTPPSGRHARRCGARPSRPRRSAGAAPPPSPSAVPWPPPRPWTVGRCRLRASTPSPSRRGRLRRGSPSTCGYRCPRSLRGRRPRSTCRVAWKPRRGRRARASRRAPRRLRHRRGGAPPLIRPWRHPQRAGAPCLTATAARRRPTAGAREGGPGGLCRRLRRRRPCRRPWPCRGGRPGWWRQPRRRQQPRPRGPRRRPRAPRTCRRRGPASGLPRRDRRRTGGCPHT
ncbi:hypothetical protein BU14_0383s0006 [Porphyra umbilicalis]|uniref:Uncharacterized protein n=1 Tax=Porphyra umbilicalis TaxID=2786 RepID=A0A1X6NWT1_PORUM|nr:hypothetical protein BU14_0383s0006 [Porphyra umbilicalis]|eukprot:OSX73032.1 hypothetical protein BU14_0383s0006 [Porphyra umbilicalis]